MGDEITNSITYPNLPVTRDTVATITLATTSMSALNIDVDGDGSIDVSLAPGEAVSSSDLIKILTKVVEALDIQRGIKNSLQAKVKAEAWSALQHELAAQSGKHIDTIEAQKLMQIIETIKNSI